jgi:hypothetical protein
MRKCHMGITRIMTLRTEVFSHKKWKKPCISTFKRTQKNMSDVRLYQARLVYNNTSLDCDDWYKIKLKSLSKPLEEHLKKPSRACVKL